MNLKKIILGTTLLSSLLFSNCRKEIQPAILPVSQKPLKPVILVPEATPNEIVSYNSSDGIIVFSNATDYSVGKVLVGEPCVKAEDGFLREITGMSSDKKTIYTKQASFEDITENADISYSERLIQTGKRGGAFDFNIPIDAVLHDFDGDTTTKGDQITAKGYVNFNHTLDVGLKIKKRRLEYFVFKNTINEDAKIEIGNEVLQNGFEKEVNIWHNKYSPILVGYIPPTPVTPFPIPVYITPILDVNLNLKGEISVSSAQVTQSAQLVAGISYENAKWNNLKSFENDFNFIEPVVSDEIGLRGSAGPHLEMLIYGIAGGYGEINAFARLNGFLSPNLNWKFYGGLEAKAGVKAEILGWNLFDYNAVLFMDSLLLAQFGGNETGTLTDFRDGKVYKTVKIGNQWWMSENLNIGQRINGIDNQTNNSIIEKYCYDDDENNCNVYGGLYQWNEMMDYNPSDSGVVGTTQGCCPVGWHLPTKKEWETLINYIGDSATAGGKLKEAGYEHWSPPNTGATNETGFSALPGGFNNKDPPGPGYFAGLRGVSYFWLASEKDVANAYRRGMYWDKSNCSLILGYKERGKSVRCIKD